MPGIARVGDDRHLGHTCPLPGCSWHQTPLAQGSPNVLANGSAVSRVGDQTSCTDPVSGGSPDVFVNGIAVARNGDPTGGHGCYVPNMIISGSVDVIVN